MTNKFKVKLAAIARDEAAYLAEWIFHHLQFGFDEIEIYVNNTVDNSLELLNKLTADLPVIVTDADPLFKSSKGDFQFRAYRELARKAAKDGFTHIMFLDIDEFWVSSNFESTIKDALEELSNPQVLSFHWKLHCDESAEFSPCFSDQITVKQSDHLKTIFQCDAPWKSIGAHNIIGDELTYTLSSGDTHLFEEEDIHRAAVKLEDYESKYFVIHRMFRSEMEYISLLGRGRPTSSLKIKNNRPGYYHKFGKLESLRFENEALQFYFDKYNQFIHSYQISSDIEKAKKYIKQRYKSVISRAQKSKGEELAVFHKVFDSLTLPEAVSTRKDIEQKLIINDCVKYQEECYSFKLFGLFILAKIMLRLGANKKAYMLYDKASRYINLDREPIVNPEVLETVSKKRNLTVENRVNIYRDIAIELQKKGFYSEAYLFIDKALELRPEGPALIKLHKQIDNKRKNQLRLH